MHLTALYLPSIYILFWLVPITKNIITEIKKICIYLHLILLLKLFIFSYILLAIILKITLS